MGFRMIVNKPSTSELERLYNSEKLSSRHIAVRFSVSCGTAARWVKEAGIELRDKHSKRQPYHLNGPHPRRKFFFTSEQLHQLRIEERRSLDNIGRMVGVSKQTVSFWLKKYGICRPRTGYPKLFVPNHKKANNFGYANEHLLAAERAVGRGLNENERVHHIDHDRGNSQPENLAVLPSTSVHASLHHYYRRVAMYLSRHRLGINATRPRPFVFGAKVFWAGEMIESLDLLEEGE